MEKNIREKWFKKHKANYVEVNDDLKILEWKRPETSYMSIRYVMDKNNVYITGDLGSAVLCLTSKASLERLSDYSLYYFSKKIVAMEQDKFDFDSEKAIEELKELFKDWWSIDMDSEVDEEYKKYKEVLGMLISGADECSRPNHWVDFVNLNYTDIESVDPDCHEWVYDVGMETSIYVKAYLIGIKMAYEQIFG